MRIISGSARGTKLFTLDGLNTRPTLDRVKEPLFNILNFRLIDSIVLDLFAGSGALGLEAISRGARKAILGENNREAQNIILKNIEKTKFKDRATLIGADFKKVLTIVSKEKIKCDVIFIDPPYKTNLIKKALVEILEMDILNDDAIIVLETDEPGRIEVEIEGLNLRIDDVRKYGRVSLFFLKQN